MRRPWYNRLTLGHGWCQTRLVGAAWLIKRVSAFEVELNRLRALTAKYRHLAVPKKENDTPSYRMTTSPINWTGKFGPSYSWFGQSSGLNRNVINTSTQTTYKPDFQRQYGHQHHQTYNNFYENRRNLVSIPFLFEPRLFHSYDRDYHPFFE